LLAKERHELWTSNLGYVVAIAPMACKSNGLAVWTIEIRVVKNLKEEGIILRSIIICTLAKLTSLA
jgi:hypothetical protein